MDQGFPWHDRDVSITQDLRMRRHAMCWERAGLACGRPALVGTTVQDPPKVPRALVADAQLTRGAQPQVSVPTPVGGGCLLGGSVGEAAATGPWAQG